MKVFYSELHRLHAPAWYVADGAARPCPEVPGRVEAILGALGGHEVERVGTSADLPAAVMAVHSAEYLEYLRTIHRVWHEEFGTDVLPDTFPRRKAARPKLAPHAQAGQFCFDLAAPITAGTWRAAVDSARVAIAAAEAARGGGAAFGLCRPPGHHAGADYCGGFCYLNNVAIAAEHLLRQGVERVAILDLDYHHGNGTQDIFYARRDVFFVSIHADPDTQYPYFWGNAEETGEGEGEGFTVNVPLPRGSVSKVWFAALSKAIKRIADYRPEALLVSFGADIHERDTVGDFCVTFSQFEEIGRRLRAMDLPTAFIQEGGYNLEAIGPCVAATLAGFESR
jgi:acetoin utilization deacetylase AcuC-like enzyme